MAPAQFIGKPAVDGAEAQFAALGAFACARHVVEQPGQLGRGKISVEFEAGAALDQARVAFGAQAVKLPAGDMVLYPSSSLHQVTPVTHGERVCAITWLQSAVADSQQRALLYDLDCSIRALSPGRAKDDPEIDRLIHVYHNLLRQWAQV